MTFLTRDKQGHVLLLTMSSPDTRNALTSDDQFADFEQTCADVNNDISIRAVVLTGEGSAFCAGGNVKDMRDRTGPTLRNPSTCFAITSRGLTATSIPSLPTTFA